MKILEFFTGGHRLKLDNLKHMQEGYIEAIEGLVKGLNELPGSGEDIFILWGCVFTNPSGGNSLAWTEGAVMHSGEFIHVPAGSTTKTGVQGFKFIISQSYLAIDPQSFVTGSHNVHQIRQGSFTGATVVLGAMYAQHASEKHLADVIQPDFQIETGLTFISSHGLGSPVWTVTSEEIKKKLVNNQMTIDVRIVSSSISSAADQLTVEIPDNKEADGSFGSVAVVNGIQACSMRVFDGGTIITINANGIDFPSGSLEAYGQIIIQVKDP